MKVTYGKRNVFYFYFIFLVAFWRFYLAMSMVAGDSVVAGSGEAVRLSGGLNRDLG